MPSYIYIYIYTSQRSYGCRTCVPPRTVQRHCRIRSMQLNEVLTARSSCQERPLQLSRALSLSQRSDGGRKCVPITQCRHVVLSRSQRSDGSMSCVPRALQRNAVIAISKREVMVAGGLRQEHCTATSASLACNEVMVGGGVCQEHCGLGASSSHNVGYGHRQCVPIALQLRLTLCDLHEVPAERSAWQERCIVRPSSRAKK